MNNLIAISGLKNAGKDTVAEMLQYCFSVPRILQNYWGYTHYKNAFEPKVNKIAFADALKWTLSVLFGIPIEKFYDREFKEKMYIQPSKIELTDHPKKRLILTDNQFSKALKNRDFSFLKEKYITIRQLLQCVGTEIVRHNLGEDFWVKRILIMDRPTIISDLRFESELKAVKEKGGTIIFVDNPKCEPSNHESESAVLQMLENQEFDYVIENNGSMKDLFNRVLNIYKQW